MNFPGASRNREQSIDLLRFIGLIMIILAHVNPPSFIMQLRNFDVPLMVLVAGMSFCISGYERGSFLSYLWKRFKRLVLPVWFFLTLYFSSLYLAFSQTLRLDEIAFSYTFVGGIGYVWIIRVLLMVAIVSPFLLILNNRVSSDRVFLCLVFVLFVAWGALRESIVCWSEGNISKLVELTVGYLVPYAIIFLIGLRLQTLNPRNVDLLLLGMSITFVSFVFIYWFSSGSFVFTQSQKYPPSIYYLSYALIISLFLFRCAPASMVFLKSLRGTRLVNFMSQNSIWIYLWHIPLIEHVKLDYVTKYFVVVVLSTLLAYLQVTLVSLLIRNINSATYRKNIKLIFTG